MFRFRHYMLFLLLMMVALTSYWIHEHPGKEPPRIEHARAPIVFVKNFVAEQMNDAGELEYKLEGELLHQVQKDTYAALTKPKLTWFGQDQIPWQITAERSIAPLNSTEIIFETHAIIQRLTDAPDKQVQISSERFLVQPDTKTISSELLVNMQTAQTSASAVGFLTNLEQEQIYLFEQVEGHHQHAP